MDSSDFDSNQVDGDIIDEKVKFLLVDDSDVILEMLKDAISDENYDIHTVKSGLEAMSNIQLRQPDVILLDHEMPGMNGDEVLHLLKKKQLLDEISVIMVTSHTYDQYVEKVLAAGACEFIPKPFSEMMVRARVRNVVRSHLLSKRHRRIREVEESANRMKSAFLASMSHEIRTPMTAILGYADILSESLKKPENINALDTIKRNGKYLLELINDILDLSKIESGKMDVEIIPCSIVKIVSEVTELMKVRAVNKGLELNTKYLGQLPETIQSDPTRLRQIIINLVGNAIKFSDSGEIQIVIRLIQGEYSQIQFEVIDKGIGLSNVQMGRLFKPFQQADNSSARKYGGTGLGLAISKKLANLLGGDIHVSSSLGQGSNFTTNIKTGSLDGIKMLAQPEKQSSEQVSPTPAVNVNINLEKGTRVLLAEDGMDNQRLISFILTKAGADVSVADNGQIAYDLVIQAMEADEPYDVILMDMQMPVLDGYRATAKLRQSGCQAPIVALTAHAMTTDRDKCLNAGCDDYLTKPINKIKFLTTVRNWAARSATASTGIQ